MTEKELLKLYADELRKLIKARIRVEPYKSKKFTYENSNLLSHFKGRPYFDEGEAWPLCEGCGEPMEFILQIGASNPDKIYLPDDILMIQFYKCPHCFCTRHEDEGWLVKTYDDIDVMDFIEIDPPYEYDGSDFCHIRYHHGKSLPDWEGLHRISPRLSKIAVRSFPDAPWKYYQKACMELGIEQEIGSALFGYPKWIQGDETSVIEGKTLPLFLAIDSEEEAGIRWMDDGMVYLFYDEKRNEFYYRMQFY